MQCECSLSFNNIFYKYFLFLFFSLFIYKCSNFSSTENFGFRGPVQTKPGHKADTLPELRFVTWLWVEMTNFENFRPSDNRYFVTKNTAVRHSIDILYHATKCTACPGRENRNTCPRLCLMKYHDLRYIYRCNNTTGISNFDNFTIS